MPPPPALDDSQIQTKGVAGGRQCCVQCKEGGHGRGYDLVGRRPAGGGRAFLRDRRRGGRRHHVRVRRRIPAPSCRWLEKDRGGTAPAGGGSDLGPQGSQLFTPGDISEANKHSLTWAQPGQAMLGDLSVAMRVLVEVETGGSQDSTVVCHPGGQDCTQEPYQKIMNIMITSQQNIFFSSKSIVSIILPGNGHDVGLC